MSKMNVAMVIFFLLNISMMPFISGDLDEAGTDAIARQSRGTIIVDKNGGGDHSTIQAAVNAASPLDTIRVWSGTYAENVVINKDLTLLGNGSATTVIDGGGKGDVVSIRSPHVDICGFRLRNSDSKGSGIDITNLSHGRISENALAGNHFGIYGGKDCCDNNTIANNTFDHNTKAGLWLRGDDNRVVGNVFSNSTVGISVTGDNNTIEDNNFTDNDVGMLMGTLQNMVLQIGNSYTYFNDLEILTRDLLRAAVPNTDASRLAGGGMTLNDHATLAKTSGHEWNTTLNGGTKWDWVVLQDQSQVPGFPTTDPDWQASLAGAVALNSMVNATGAQTLLLMTWGRKDGDSTNPTLYPDYLTMQALLENGYRMYAENVSTPERPVFIAPVGLAWKHIYTAVIAQGATPTSPGNLFYDLYDADGSHPALAGSYLAACVLYATLTGRTPVGLTDGTTLNSSYRLLLQEAAAATVFNETPSYEYPWEIASPLQSASGNRAVNNSFRDNHGLAAAVLEPRDKDNVLFHNEFLNNGNGAKQSLDNGTGNTWDDGREGNYWSDYVSRYPGATNNGVVWNTPYDNNGTSKSKDRYPLLIPFRSRDPVPPVADAGPDQTVFSGIWVFFNGSGSKDNVGIVNYSWSFSYNGSARNIFDMKPSFMFEMPGNYSVTLRVRDAALNEANDTMNVTVIKYVPPDTTAPFAPPGLDLNRTVENGTNVSFEAGKWTDSESPIVNYTWLFAYNGTIITMKGNVTWFIFNAKGNFSAMLTVTNSVNLSCVQEFWVLVYDDETPPVVEAGPDATVDQHTRVLLDGTASTDNKAITRYMWTFEDDGTRILDGPITNYTFDNAGTFLILLMAHDARGNMGSDTMTVTVVDITSPVAEAGPDIAVDMGAMVTFNGSLSTDNVGIIDYEWNFEDDDSTILLGVSPSHRFERPDVFPVTLRVHDAAGNIGMDRLNVTVRDTERPVAKATASAYTIKVGKVVTLDGGASSDNVAIVNWTWDVGGNVLSGPYLNFTFDKVGTINVSLTVLDAAGNEATTSFTIVVEAPEKEATTKSIAPIEVAMAVFFLMAVMVPMIILAGRLRKGRR